MNQTTKAELDKESEYDSDYANDDIEEFDNNNNNNKDNKENSLDDNKVDNLLDNHNLEEVETMNCRTPKSTTPTCRSACAKKTSAAADVDALAVLVKHLSVSPPVSFKRYSVACDGGVLSW